MILPVSSPNSHIEIARALLKNGFQVTVIVLNGQITTRIEKYEGINIYHLNTKGIRFSPFKAFLNPLTTLMIIIQALKTKSCVFWGRGYATLPCMLILKLMNKRVVYQVGDDDIANMVKVAETRYHLSLFSKALRVLLWFFECMLISRANYTITLTESLRTDRSRYTNSIQAVYYSISKHYSTDPINNDLKTNLQDKIVTVYSGTIALQKGFLEIIRAYEIIKCKIPSIALLFAGGILPIDTKAIHRQLSKHTDVYITGWLPYRDMPNYIALGDIGLAIINHINYSYKISLPFKLIEQMACGLPIIAPKGFPEIEKVIKTANCGYLVDHQNPEEFASVVIELANNKNKRKLLGNNAVKYIEENHNLENFEARINSIINEVVSDAI